MSTWVDPEDQGWEAVLAIAMQLQIFILARVDPAHARVVETRYLSIDIFDGYFRTI
jgi:hypothetical protein